MSEDDLEFDYEEIVGRMMEEVNVRNTRELSSKIGFHANYGYQIKREGISRGYLEKFIQTFPDADLNYIYKGTKSKTTRSSSRHEAVLKMIRTLIDDTLKNSH